MNLQSEFQNLKILLFGGTLKLKISEILAFKPIYVILIYLYLAHFMIQERTEHHLHESSVGIVKFKNLTVWWDLEIDNFRNFGL